MARAGEQVKGFRTQAPKSAPSIVLGGAMSGRPENGGGKRVVAPSGDGGVFIGGTRRVTNPKSNGRGKSGGGDR
jgi:hypothetical protein